MVGTGCPGGVELLAVREWGGAYHIACPGSVWEVYRAIALRSGAVLALSMSLKSFILQWVAE